MIKIGSISYHIGGGWAYFIYELLLRLDLLRVDRSTVVTVHTHTQKIEAKNCQNNENRYNGGTVCWPHYFSDLVCNLRSSGHRKKVR